MTSNPISRGNPTLPTTGTIARKDQKALDLERFLRIVPFEGVRMAIEDY
jgi:hypothetical protein